MLKRIIHIKIILQKPYYLTFNERSKIKKYKFTKS